MDESDLFRWADAVMALTVLRFPGAPEATAKAATIVALANSKLPVEWQFCDVADLSLLAATSVEDAGRLLDDPTFSPMRDVGEVGAAISALCCADVAKTYVAGWFSTVACLAEWPQLSKEQRDGMRKFVPEAMDAWVADNV